ncbi:hypothetical protein BUALT_Bualt01G0220900 [Buddleja alternifolia]|uniref:Uncharacterized protein n=1 Tax=Buddleja alternifolia TaxID=168488 RepID=A0AAV6YA42_9LAMI|nr:hypothetical protein BUALT_Bualt01G0220900 [Buddleja alternifolia]
MQLSIQKRFVFFSSFRNICICFHYKMLFSNKTVYQFSRHFGFLAYIDDFFHRKVDVNGSVDLNNILKISQGYDKDGFQLENIVFEVINRDQGEIDESVHDEEKHDQSNILTINTASARHGCYSICAIALP